jgi:hypothetical protein
MLRKALEKIDEKTIAEAFGIDYIRTRLNYAFHKDLHPDVLAEMRACALTQTVAKELTYVVPKRQLEILALMREGGDRSLACAKAQILATQPSLRSKKERLSRPWDRGEGTKRDLAKKLAEAEKHYDSYSALCRQYVADLLKLAIYVRQIVTRPELRDHLARQRPADLEFLESVLVESEGKAAG